MSEAEEPQLDEAGAPVRFPPPFVPLIALAVGAVIQQVAGPLPGGLAGGARYALGGVAVVAGLALIAVAHGLFVESGQNPKPWTNSPRLIAKGIYRWTRNPMYLGMGVLQAGLGVLFTNLWIVVLVPVTWIVIYYIAIRHEEAYLEESFGTSYVDYKQSVRRWL